MNTEQQNLDKRSALIVVDVQLSFLNDRNRYVVDNILKLLDDKKYDLYVEATFHAEKGSLWEKQQNWICPEGRSTKTISEISNKLAQFDPIKIHKETKSVFKGDSDVFAALRKGGISEVHVVGLDTNDCVMATAFESFDLGFLTYVIENCCQSSSSDELHEYALEILRGQDMVI